MTIHPLFVAGVLEGFEGTLGEMVGRVENQKLNTQLDALRSQVAALRIGIEDPLRQVEATEPCSFVRATAGAGVRQTRPTVPK
jgi:hypothetical protein